MFDNPDTIFLVVVNHEEQYSIWPIDREIPLGWNPVGKEGNKQECLDYIEEVWTDMRPLSLRKKMDELKKQFQHYPLTKLAAQQRGIATAASDATACHVASFKPS